jgi:hypothetical protein
MVVEESMRRLSIGFRGKSPSWSPQLSVHTTVAKFLVELDIHQEFDRTEYV